VVPITQQRQLLQGCSLSNTVLMIHYPPKSKNYYLSTICWRFTTQGVVTTNSLVEPSATGIKVFDRRKYTLIA